MSTPATAPALIDVAPDAGWRWFSLVLGSASGLTLAAWISGELSWPMWAAVAAMVMLATAGAALGSRALRAPVGILRRQGEAWLWHDAAQVDLSAEGDTQGDLVVTIDLGRWMLVRFVPVDAVPHARWPHRRRRPLWLPLSAASAGGAAWSAWRALLLSRRATMPDRLRQADRGPTSTDR